MNEINSDKTICIYGDYDADGVTSVCILSKAFSRLTDNFFYYIPSRFSEGYGLNEAAIDRIKARGADMIITVDCGSVSYNEVEHAKDIGLKVIVTDHHTIDNIIADCIVINPKHPENEYPFRELAGCGVAFKIVQAMQRTAGLPRSILTEVLDLAAIGTVGDIVSLTDENRTIVKYGLKMLNQRRSAPLKTLTRQISVDTIDSGSIAYGIVPRINAAGRIREASDAVDFFMAKESQDIIRTAGNLIEYNNQRRKLQDDAYFRCLEHISGDELFILLRMDDIHEGIAGIVAGKIKEKFNRPAVIVMPDNKGTLKGTGRSIAGVDLHKVLSKASHLFKNFGGHKGACGFTMIEDGFDELNSIVNSEMKALLIDNPGLLEHEINCDLELEAGEVSLELAETLKQIEPCGEGNPQPVFKLRGITPKNMFYMGKDKNHVRFDAVSDDGTVTCILFNDAQSAAQMLNSGRMLDLTGKLNINEWNGLRKVQFVLEAIEYAD